MNVCFFGAGGVGSFYGALLTKHVNAGISIAKALKINLPSDIIEKTFSKAGQFPFKTKTSFQRDVELKGGQSEWDLPGGTIIRYGEKLNIPVQATKDTLNRLLRDMQ